MTSEPETMTAWPTGPENWWQELCERWPEIAPTATTHPLPFIPDAPEGDQPRVPAAVLIPFVVLPDGGLGITFIQRPDHMPSHPGQVAFPGGKVDDVDDSDEAAALRETWEEIGVPPEQVELAGRMRTFPTLTTRFTITPVLGRFVPRRPSYEPNPAEVVRVLEVPLDWLRDPSNRHVVDAVYRGRRFPRLEFVWQGHIIWGATAKILDTLLPLLP